MRKNSVKLAARRSRPRPGCIIQVRDDDRILVGSEDRSRPGGAGRGVELDDRLALCAGSLSCTWIGVTPTTVFGS